MRRVNLAGVVCLLLACASSPVSAAVIHFNDAGWELDFYFDPHMARWEGPLAALTVDGNWVEDDYLANPWATFQSGPRTDLTLLYEGGVHVESLYSYAPGMFTITFGSPHAPLGTFKAPTLPLTFSVELEHHAYPDFCPCANPIPIELGAGKFSAGVASALGVRRYTTGGLIELWRHISPFEGADEPRYGYYNGGAVTIVTAVPEPSLSALAALAVPAAALWRLRRRGSRLNVSEAESRTTT
jgi:hypothetical protein